MLALEIHFLLGRYVATDFRDRERAEWPPHPSRLFSALVAAACESGKGESARAALLWLESLPPPHICAEEQPAQQTAVTVFVPVNDPTNPVPPRVERQPRAFPSAIPQDPTVYLVWPDAQPDTVLRRLLADIAANVTYLGSSRSPVRVRLTDWPPHANWTPNEAGEALLRVPSEGRLESLEWHYQNRLRPSPGAFQRYRRGPYSAETLSAESSFGEMVVYRLEGPVEMEIETTLKLTSLLRRAVLRRAQDTGPTIPEVLSGHDEKGKPSPKPHAAYVALPFASQTQEYADGHILGLAVVLPRQLGASERRRAMQALIALEHLTVGGVGRLGLRRILPGMAVPHNLRTSTWTEPSRRWSSVTPVVFDRFPKRNGRGLEASIARSCGYVGLPAPTEVVAEHHSPLYGVEPSFRFVTRRAALAQEEREPGPRLYTHVTLTFDQPVCGPVLLGASRHFGLGLLRPLHEENP
jgi:CRISPR-associated protein Csb2